MVYVRKMCIIKSMRAMDFLLLRVGSFGILLLGTLFFFGCASVPPLPLDQHEMIEHASITPEKEIRILTMNVWSGLTYKGVFKMGEYQNNPEKRYSLLVSEILKLSPDIIAIQEANPLPHYAKRLATDLDYSVIYSVALGGVRFGFFGIPTNMREGSAILLKRPWTFEYLDRRRLRGQGITTNWFCLHFGETTQALLGRVIIHGRPLYIYNIHLHESPFKGSTLETVLERLAREMTKEKVEEAKRVLERDIERRKVEITNLIKFVENTLPAGMPAIILGDFNTTVESGELNPLLAEGKWVDTFGFKNPNEEGVTWDPQNNPNYPLSETSKTLYDTLYAYHRSHSYRIDFILVNENIPKDDIIRSRVVMTPVGGFSPSDHYGVLTTLIIP